MESISVLRDDFSSYKWLIPLEKSNTDVASNRIAHWIRVSTSMEIWVSDQGSHFKNSIMKSLADKHNINQKFQFHILHGWMSLSIMMTEIWWQHTDVYNPSSSLERNAGRDMLEEFRQFPIELLFTDWELESMEPFELQWRVSNQSAWEIFQLINRVEKDDITIEKYREFQIQNISSLQERCKRSTKMWWKGCIHSYNGIFNTTTKEKSNLVSYNSTLGNM